MPGLETAMNAASVVLRSAAVVSSSSQAIGHSACQTSRPRSPRRAVNSDFCSSTIRQTGRFHRRSFNVTGTRSNERSGCLVRCMADPYVSSVHQSRREYMLDYVSRVDPQSVDAFMQQAPQQVVDAMKQSITSMLGTLPPQFFEIQVSTISENLAQLMYTVLMTGYMFRNAEVRVELNQGVGGLLPDTGAPPALVSMSVDSGRYTFGSKTQGVKGHVERWNTQAGAEQVPAAEYIALLEQEVLALRERIREQERAVQADNEILRYLRRVDTQALQELSNSASEDVIDAMNSFIHRLMGTSDLYEMRTAQSQCSAMELAKLLLWLMVVGYQLRNMEVRFDMERALLLPTAELRT